MKKLMQVMALLAIVPAVLFGCAKSDDESVTNPNPQKFQPKGTIQGYLYDATTQEPIVGAVVDIGMGTGTTNDRGVFTIRNVPATYDAINGTVSADYDFVIDLRGVSSPVNMRDAAAAPRYPSFVYPGRYRIAFTSLDDTSGDEPGAGSGSNHDTPVDGLIGSFNNYSIGKLAATIKGCVVNGTTRASVGAGYTVRLVSTGSDNSATGGSGRMLAETVTDESGEFTFAGVESFQYFTVVATNDAMLGQRTVSAGADGTTVDLTCRTGGCEAVQVRSVDDCAPIITSCTPEYGVDLAPTEAQTVTFTFSEPIDVEDNPYALALTADKATIQGVYNDLRVDRSAKTLDRAGNIAHTMAWNPDMTALTVTFATVGSSRYDVKFVNFDYDSLPLTDRAGNRVDFGGSVCTGTAFTTEFVDGVAAAPVIALVGEPYDYDSIPALDWIPSAGAKSYNVYCGVNQVWGDVVNEHSMQFLGSSDGSFFFDHTRCGRSSAPTFVEDSHIQLTFTYVVKSVDVDGLESVASNAVTAADTVKPTIRDGSFEDFSPNAFAALAVGETLDAKTLRLFFSEPLDEASAETLANYVFAALEGAAATDVVPTATSAVYDQFGHFVDLTLVLPAKAAGATYSGNWSITVSGIADVAGNVMDATTEINDFVPAANFDVTNATSLATFGRNEAPSSLVLDWAPVSDTATYEIVVQKRDQTGAVVGTSNLNTGLATLGTANLAAFGPLFTNPDRSYFTVQVRAFEDDVWVAKSNIFTVRDMVGPAIVNVAGGLPAFPAAAGETTTSTVTVTFNEPMRKVQAETLASYTLTATGTVAATDLAVTITRAELAADNQTLILTFQVTRPAVDPDPAPTGVHPDWVLKVVTGLDLVDNAIRLGFDEWAFGVFPVRDPVVAANPF